MFASTIVGVRTLAAISVRFVTSTLAPLAERRGAAQTVCYRHTVDSTRTTSGNDNVSSGWFWGTTLATRGTRFVAQYHGGRTLRVRKP